ncbi:zinc-finger domain-containing protein [Oleisolibacter albus]|uniref:zinc-finger domain-containing protein n=1 Tax=Oleisolibacter albus TaxID=2171757 RepID=UPI000DF30BB1|nr:zinc-finger domain-containing protein [Oleisolibacter albus]
MQPLETIYVDDSTVGCDGGGGALGHPMVYLSLEKKGAVDCPYCGRRYIQTEDGKRHAGHGH